MCDLFFRLGGGVGLVDGDIGIMIEGGSYEIGLGQSTTFKAHVCQLMSVGRLLVEPPTFQ